MPVLETLALGSIILGGAGTLTNAWMQWAGLQEGRKESRRTEGLQMRMWEKAERTRKEERREDVRFREKQFGEQVSLNNFNKRQTFLDTVLGQMNQKPQLANNFITAQRGRA